MDWCIPKAVFFSFAKLSGFGGGRIRTVVHRALTRQLFVTYPSSSEDRRYVDIRESCLCIYHNTFESLRLVKFTQTWSYR